ncbi:MAG TPA: hypothetical protein VJR02_18165 [Pyrinomonadaceae bacterium]|nr:hypothetical protein [Pyrinomonadaceae bacterium]
MDNETPEQTREHIPLETDELELAFYHYATNPDAALDCARRLFTIKQFLESDPPEVPLAIRALRDAIQVLYPHTDFHKAGRDLFELFLSGGCTTAHESLMRSLGIRF